MLKTSKNIFSLALGFAMCLVIAATTYANPFDNGVLSGTEAEPAMASINKTLQVPVGTITPNTQFIFEIKGISVDGVVSNSMPIIGTPVGAGAPTTGTVTIDDFTNADTGNVVGDIKKVVWESDNIFDLMPSFFTAAGVYVYEFTERPETNPSIDDNDNINEFLTYSEGKYTMTIVVMNGVNGLYIGSIVTVINETDHAGQSQDAKVDPTPETERNETTHPLAPNSELVFTNTYVKQNGLVDPDDPDPLTEATLGVNKEVTGALGNKEAYFEFNVIIRNNSIVTDRNSYNAYIVEDGAAIISASDMADTAKNNVTSSGTDLNGNAYITFTVATAKTIFLKHNQSLVFIDTPVGTHYDVEEISPTGHVPSYVIKTNNVEAARVTGTVGTTLAANNNLVGELENEAAFRNNRDFTAPTGLKANDLPFVGMILLAAGAFAAFIVTKTRRMKRVNH